MKIKSLLSLIVALFMFVSIAPSSHAYVDSLGRVWPGKKPSAHKITQHKGSTTLKKHSGAKKTVQKKKKAK